MCTSECIHKEVSNTLPLSVIEYDVDLAGLVSRKDEENRNGRQTKEDNIDLSS